MSDNPTPRDPRVDPKPGDVLRKRTIRREVLARYYRPSKVLVIDGGLIGKPNLSNEKEPTLKQFRRWAKNAEVIHAAD